MFISTRSKSITRATILYAFHKVQGMDTIPGPKSIGVHGDSYIYAVFKALGVINPDNHTTLGRNHTTPGYNLIPEEGNEARDAQEEKSGAGHILDSHDRIEAQKIGSPPNRVHEIG